MASHDGPSARDVITAGSAVLGIELGSTRIKAVLIDPLGRHLAGGSHTWENRFVDRVWTYTDEDIWSGVQGSFVSMCADAQERHGVRPTSLGALGVSAMMHGYLAVDASGDLLTPFRDLAQHDDRPVGGRAHRTLRVHHPAALVDRAPIPGDPG